MNNAYGFYCALSCIMNFIIFSCIRKCYVAQMVTYVYGVDFSTNEWFNT